MECFLFYCSTWTDPIPDLAPFAVHILDHATPILKLQHCNHSAHPSMPSVERHICFLHGKHFGGAWGHRRVALPILGSVFRRADPLARPAPGVTELQSGVGGFDHFCFCCFWQRRAHCKAGSGHEASWLLRIMIQFYLSNRGVVLFLL